MNRSDKHRKKFQYIVQHILEGKKNLEVYDKEDINDRCRDVTAMKLFKGGSNDRIYCKETKAGEGVFVVVTARLHEKRRLKKTQNAKSQKSK